MDADYLWMETLLCLLNGYKRKRSSLCRGLIKDVIDYIYIIISYIYHSKHELYISI